MCTWRWKTCCPAPPPWFHPMLYATGCSAASILRVTSFTVWKKLPTASSGRSWSVTAWTRGTTSVCPRAIGTRSRKATPPGPSWTTCAGTVPATIPQKRHWATARLLAAHASGAERRRAVRYGRDGDRADVDGAARARRGREVALELAAVSERDVHAPGETGRAGLGERDGPRGLGRGAHRRAARTKVVRFRERRLEAGRGRGGPRVFHDGVGAIRDRGVAAEHRIGNEDGHALAVRMRDARRADEVRAHVRGAGELDRDARRVDVAERTQVAGLRPEAERRNVHGRERHSTDRPLRRVAGRHTAAAARRRGERGHHHETLSHGETPVDWELSAGERRRNRFRSSPR